MKQHFSYRANFSQSMPQNAEGKKKHSDTLPHSRNLQKVALLVQTSIYGARAFLFKLCADTESHTHHPSIHCVAAFIHIHTLCIIENRK